MNSTPEARLALLLRSTPLRSTSLPWSGKALQPNRNDQIRSARAACNPEVEEVGFSIAFGFLLDTTLDARSSLDMVSRQGPIRYTVDLYQDVRTRGRLMSRTVVDLDDEALSLASEELGTTSKVATVNAALRRVANQRAAARMLELLDETGTDLSDETLQGAWRDGGR
jgi:Arc/MetJ family transcription regulator